MIEHPNHQKNGKELSINIDKSEVEITKKGNLKMIFYSQKKSSLTFYKALFKKTKIQK